MAGPAAADLALIARLDDRTIVALTVWAEARNQGPEGMLAVVDVILNRVRAKRPKAFGATARGVCLQRAQFSCWSPAGGPLEAKNYARLMATARLAQRPTRPPALAQAFAAVDAARDVLHEDTVMGSCHYMTEALWRTGKTKWARGHAPVCQIGDHVFFAGIA